METEFSQSLEERNQRLSELGVGTLEQNFPFYGEREKSVSARVNRDAARMKYAPEKVTFEFTRDPGFLHQYYLLRERMFVSSWGLEQFSGQEDPFDAKGHVAIARAGNLVVAGFRLSLREAGSDALLPMEGKDLRLNQLFPQFNLGQCLIAEYCRPAVLPEYHMQSITQQLLSMLSDKAVELGARYAFALCPAAEARNYGAYFRPHGYGFQILDARIPEHDEHEGASLRLAVVDYKTSQPAAASRPAVAVVEEPVA